MGRPSKRTPEVEESIIRALKLGLDYTTAAEVAGIHRDTLQDWRSKDPEFSVKCKRAKSNGKVHVSAQLMKQINSGNVSATIFWLKTRTEEFREIQHHAPMDQSSVDDDRYL